MDINTLCIDEIDKNWKEFYQLLKKDDYFLLEKFIIENRVEIVSFIFLKLDKINDRNFLKIFKPGFLRDEKHLKRQLPCYLYFASMDNMKELLLTFYLTRNYMLKYWNDTIYF